MTLIELEEEEFNQIEYERVDAIIKAEELRLFSSVGILTNSITMPYIHYGI